MRIGSMGIGSRVLQGSVVVGLLVLSTACGARAPVVRVQPHRTVSTRKPASPHRSSVAKKPTPQPRQAGTAASSGSSVIVSAQATPAPTVIRATYHNTWNTVAVSPMCAPSNLVSNFMPSVTPAGSPSPGAPSAWNLRITNDTNYVGTNLCWGAHAITGITSSHVRLRVYRYDTSSETLSPSGMAASVRLVPLPAGIPPFSAFASTITVPELPPGYYLASLHGTVAYSTAGAANFQGSLAPISPPSGPFLVSALPGPSFSTSLPGSGPVSSVHIVSAPTGLTVKVQVAKGIPLGDLTVHLTASGTGFSTGVPGNGESLPAGSFYFRPIPGETREVTVRIGTYPYGSTGPASGLPGFPVQLTYVLADR